MVLERLKGKFKRIKREREARRRMGKTTLGDIGENAEGAIEDIESGNLDMDLDEDAIESQIGVEEEFEDDLDINFTAYERLEDIK